MAKGKESASGYDPLAWLKEEEPGAEPAAEAAASEPTAAPPAEAPAADPRVLGEELTIVQVAEMHGQWLPLLAGDGPLVLEAGAVAQVDAAGVQLLLALARTLSAAGRTLELHAPTPALCRGAELLGVGAELGLPPPEER